MGHHRKGSQKSRYLVPTSRLLINQLVPTGKIVRGNGIPYDFLKPRTISSKIKKLPDGYDINYVLDGGEIKQAAVVKHKNSGRILELWTNAPGMQFYTANGVKDVKGKGGYVYRHHAGLCLETQRFPDVVNHPYFPSQIASKGKVYTHSVLFEFSTETPTPKA